MATKKITDLVEITTAASDDVLPIVDVSLDITNKITTTNLLKGKQDLLESGTNIKTINSTSLLGSGDVAVQETLVSGTNIKTINSTSLLGSGDISISANPSGGAGLIQFSDGSAFASDSNLFWDNTNKRLGIGTSSPTDYLTINNSGTRLSLSANAIFNYGLLDTTGNTIIFVANGVVAQRVHKDGVQIGVPSGIPTARLHVRGSGSTSATTALLVQNSGGNNALQVRDDRVIIMAGLPISSSGLPSGAIWNDSGTLKIV